MASIDSRPHLPILNGSGERRIWPVIAAACLVPAVLDALQTYFQAKLTGEPARCTAETTG